MNIEEYVNKNTRANRTKHIDLNKPFKPARAKCNTRFSKKGDILTGKRLQQRHAVDSLKNFLNLEGKTNRHIQLCHLCDCEVKHGSICIQPHHIYFGTTQENAFDKPYDVRQRGAIASKKKGWKQTTFQKDVVRKVQNEIVTCPHCNKSGQSRAMKRWHFDRCKHKV